MEKRIMFRMIYCAGILVSISVSDQQTSSAKTDVLESKTTSINGSGETYSTQQFLNAWKRISSQNDFSHDNITKIFNYGDFVGSFDMFNVLHERRLVITSKCANDTFKLIRGLFDRDGWAIQFFDASGKPGPSVTKGWLKFVGNYAQCTSAIAPSELSSDGKETRGFRGGYFKVAFKSPSIPVLMEIGLCLPDTCSEEEVKFIGTKILGITNVSATVDSVRHLTNDTEVTTATVIAIIAVSIIGLLIICGTVYDIVFIQYPVWYDERLNELKGLLGSDKSKVSNNGAVLGVKNGICSDNGETAPLLSPLLELKPSNTNRSKSTLTKAIIAFSVYSNGKKILNVSQAPGVLGSIHGIRFLSMTWVVLGHLYVISRTYALNGSTAFPILLDRWTFDVIANAMSSVDTFFTLSGLLVSYLTIDHLKKTGLKMNWPMFYFHRFWRLTPPYMLVVLIYLGFQQYFIRGPLRNFEQPTDKSNCEDNWWTNLLYINNFVHSEKQCMIHTWYMANDMQFFILSPLLIIPLYFHHMAGLCSCLLFLLASWITTGLSSNLEDWPAARLTKNNIQALPLGSFWSHYYIKPWCRIGPFVVGIFAGYLLATFKGRSVNMKWWVVTLGWLTATVSALAVIYGLRGDISGDDPSSVDAAALYNAVSRSVWGACISWVVIACTTGYGGPVNTFLSWSPFVLLGRLSYMVYLIHIPVISIYLQNLDYPLYLNDTNMAIAYLGLLVATSLLAFVFMLGLESPMISLEKTFLKT